MVFRFLVLYPNGSERKKGVSLSLAIKLAEYSILGSGQSVYADYKLHVKDEVSG